MHRVAIALVVCAVGSAYGQDSGHPQLEVPAVETVLRVTETSFEATSLIGAERLLLFTDSNGPLSLAHLPAGGELSFSFAPGATRDVQVEVLSLDAHGVRHGVPIDLGMDTFHGSALWIQTGHVTTTWIQTPRGLQRGASYGYAGALDFWSPPQPEVAFSESTNGDSNHVPVPDPDDPPRPDDPPDPDPPLPPN